MPVWTSRSPSRPAKRSCGHRLLGRQINSIAPSPTTGISCSTLTRSSWTAGTFANGQDNKPWVDKEKIGLDKYVDENDADVIRTKVRVDYDGSPQSGRYYDGLEKNGDGPNTYTAIEVKSGSAFDEYSRPGNTQSQFDDAVNGGTPARGVLEGEEIVITKGETEIVP